ncbi:MAG: hypothetical protein IPK15_04685 [Verrucomicrobia bacterium]|nr:hypothetical protein [Verrucomicrobiota bacterium]
MDWSTRDRTVMRRLRNHESGIRALRVSSNDQFLASGSDKSLRIWDLKDAAYSFDTFGERVRALSYRDVNPASRGNAKPKFASSDGNGIQLWQPSGVIGAHRWREALSSCGLRES